MNLTTVFPRPEAAATNFFTLEEAAATIRGRRQLTQKFIDSPTLLSVVASNCFIK